MPKKKIATPYEPSKESLAHKVVEYFKLNPEEELTKDDIADKFEFDPRYVGTSLAQAVIRRVLIRERNHVDEEVWKPGPAGPFRDWPFGKNPDGTTKRRKAVSFDVGAVELFDDVPVYERPTLHKQLLLLLQRMRKGQHFKVPVEARGVVTGARSAFCKVNPGVEFTIRQINRVPPASLHELIRGTGYRGPR